MGHSDRIVFIMEDPDAPPESRFVGHVEDVGPDGLAFLAEEGPGWPDAETAIRWGRDHAQVVMIRTAAKGEYLSAGELDPERPLPSGERAKRWPG